MPYEPHRNAPPPRGPIEPGLRDLLTFLRDTFRDAASRIDRYLGEGGRDRAAPPPQPMMRERDRDSGRDRDRDRDRGAPAMPAGGSDVGIRMPLESLRDEARRISNEASDTDPAELRLQIEAVTAETRSLQNRATDPEDQDIAAKILRALTAIVSEHRPGHVYGLARHHQADWDEVGRRARREMGQGGGGEYRGPHDDHR